MTFYSTFWQLKLEKVKNALEKNNFEVYLAENCKEAGEIIKTTILPAIDACQLVSYGDSMTLHKTGILDFIKANQQMELIETFPPGASREEKTEVRRKGLLTDLFFTGSNALTEDGKLVNLDMVGNRVAGIIFGPRNVILTIGRNKIVPDVERAMQRVKEIAAPLNAIRHKGMKTPCIKTGECMDCKSPDRICNNWVITEKCFPKKRIKIVLINEDEGL